MTREECFNQWLTLKYDIQNIAGIVQNDIPVTESDILEWLNIVDKFKIKFEQMKSQTLKII